MPRISLDRLDQGWNQVPSALELDVDVAPGTIRPLVETDELIVSPGQVEEHQDHNTADDPPEHDGSPSIDRIDIDRLLRSLTQRMSGQKGRRPTIRVPGHAKVSRPTIENALA